MKKRLILLMTLALLLAAAQSAMAQSQAQARFAHLAPGLPAIDVYVNSQLAVAGLGYGEASAYLMAPAGDVQVAANLAGSDSVAFVDAVSLESGAAASLVVFDALAPSFQPVAENLDAVEFGKARFSVVHAIAEAPAVDIVVKDTGQVLGANVMPGDLVGPYEMDASEFELALVPAGADLEASLFDLQFSTTAGTSHLAIVHGGADDPQLLLTAAATAGMPGSGSARFVHAVAGATPFSVLINGDMIIPALAYAAPSEHIALPGGNHDVAFRIGSAEIATASLSVAAGSAQTVIIMGTPASLDLAARPDDMRLMDQSTALVSLINAIPDSTVDRLSLSSGILAAADVVFGESSGVAKITTGEQSLSLELTIGEESGVIAVPASYIYGGVYYNMIALPGSAFSSPRLLIAETSVDRGLGAAVMMMPSADEMPPQESDDEPVETMDAIPLQPSSVAMHDGPTALVRLNPGANLQLRQYPHPDSRSLGLAPARARLLVQGRRGITEYYGAEPQDEPVDLSDFDSDPAEGFEWWQDLEPADTWLFITYPTPDGGAIDAWVNALYLDVVDANGDEQRLAKLEMVRQNQAGSAVGTAIGPPQPADRVTAVVGNLDAGVRLNIRVANDPSSENLSQVETGAVLRLIGYDETDDWAFIEYRAADDVAISGWVSAAYITLRLDGKPTSLEILRARPDSLVAEVSDERRGSVNLIGDAEAPAAPERDPFLGVVVGTVTVDPGANLHLRVNPAAFTESLDLLASGTQMIVNGINSGGDWYRVDYDGVTGWVSAKFMTLSFNGRILPRVDLEARLALYDNIGNRVSS